MRKVFLDDLPHSVSGKTIKWNESVNKDVKFIYDNINGEFKIINYKTNGKQAKIKVLYNNTEQWIYAGQLNSSQIGTLIGANRNNSNQKRRWRYEIGDYIKDKYNDLEITDRKDGKYKFICHKCGYKCGKHYFNQKLKEEYWMILSHKAGCKTLCPCCSNTIVVPGINDLATITPEIVKYFKGNTLEEKSKLASMFRPYSNRKADVQCPNCGRIYPDIMISNLQKGHFGCKCMKQMSYPEGFFASMLEQLNIKFIFNRKHDWCTFYNPFKNKETYGRYDFLLSDLKLIVEIDGGYGHGHIYQRKDEDVFIDNKKDELARKNGYDIIRIKALESNLEYMRRQICQSNILKYINIDKVDFSICNKNARKSKYNEIYKLYTKGYSATKISSMVGLSVTTVLRFFNDNNLEYNTKSCKGIHNIKNSKPIKIETYQNSNIFVEYPSVHILSDRSKKDFGEFFSADSVGNAIRAGKTYKGRIVKYV